MAKSVEHNVFPELTPRAEIFEKIGLLEKSWLDEASIGMPAYIDSMMNNFCFIKINGAQAIFDKSDETLNTLNFTPNFFSGIHNQGYPLIFLTRFYNLQLNIYLGTNNEGISVLQALLESVMGDHLYEHIDTPNNIKQKEIFTFCSAITGIPTLFDNQKTKNKKMIWHSGIDGLISGLGGRSWIYIVQAFPIQRKQSNNWFESCSREIKDIKEAFLHRDIQKSNRSALYYIELLEKTLKRLTVGKQLGLWQTGVYFASSEKETVKSGATLLSSLHSGDKSTPEPIRCHLCNKESDIMPFINCYNSKELFNFISVPSKEFPGFRVDEQVNFDIDIQNEKEKPISIGQIKDSTKVLDQHYCTISINDLNRHGLVAGVTGSGKTNTIFNLLLQAYKIYKIPFLIIEPAKAEYRNLLHGINDLIVFTIGEERPNISTPFRCNPFYFPQGISLQTHIDFLKAVFNASFVMYAPMPYILEECLYKIYEDKGWDLVTSINVRGNEISAFPTLSDLYIKVDEVVERIGYQDRTSMDIRAALKTRINNLCIGGKGMMLNTKQSIPFSKIMKTPTVFELKYLGNDEEKAFMIGLILMAVWEYYESQQGISEKISNDLNHLMVIEEAHRLLKNVPTEKVSEDQSNIKGKSVETFCHLMSEIRAYGEGVLVSEQIPTKLAPDVIKNSNLKIMHRVVAKDDRDVMGEAMNFNSFQNRHACTLNVGEAIFYGEGLDRPIKIQNPVSEVIKIGTQITNNCIHKNMKNKFYAHNQSYIMKYLICANCRNINCADCESTKQQVILARKSNNWLESQIKFFTPYIINSDWNIAPFNYFNTIFQYKDHDEPLRYCLFAEIISDYLTMKGDFYNWPYHKIDMIKLNAWNEIESEMFVKIIAKYCHTMANDYNYTFSLCRDYCQQKGLLCYEGKILAKDPFIHNKLVNLLNSDNQNDNFHHELVIMLINYIKDYLISAHDNHYKSFAICYLIQKCNEHRFSLKLQNEILKGFVETFDNKQR